MNSQHQIDYDALQNEFTVIANEVRPFLSFAEDNNYEFVKGNMQLRSKILTECRNVQFKLINRKQDLQSFKMLDVERYNKYYTDVKISNYDWNKDIWNKDIDDLKNNFKTLKDFVEKVIQTQNN